MKKRKTGIRKRLGSFLLALALLFVLGNPAKANAQLAVQPALGAAGTAVPGNPVHHCTGRRGGSDYTEWNYVYFGSYPQTEVAGSALTAAVTSASYDAQGDVWVGNAKYRRIKKSDANQDTYFGDRQYRYFKWERIRWRVLNNEGGTLFVMADRGLDCKNYDDGGGDVTWENSTLRSWLNHDFYSAAFGSGEQRAVKEQTLDNEDNFEYGTYGGNDTRDYVFLLSLDDVSDLDYGFCDDESVLSASRWVQPSEYAHARGAYTITTETTGGNANGEWWLRSPGSEEDSAALVSYGGAVYAGGLRVSNGCDACVPALYIDLSSGQWLLEDDGTSGYGGDDFPPVVSAPKDQTVRAGTSATFQVTASNGRPSAYAYQWYYAPTALGAGMPVAGAKAPSYTIPAREVTGGLNGSFFYCVVSNGLFQTASKRAKLTVLPSGGATGGNNGSGSGGSGAPVSLKAPRLKAKLSSANAIKISWGKVSGASGYTLYRAESAKGKYKKIASTKKTSYTDKKRKSGKTYYYKAQAYKGKAKGKRSAAVSKQIPEKPATPRQKKIAVNTARQTFTIAWDKIRHADKVIILRRVDGGRFKAWKTVSAKKGKAVFSYRNYARGHRYSYQLRAYCTKEKIKIYGGYSNVYAMVM